VNPATNSRLLRLWARKGLRSALRGVFTLAVAIKLLVPVGYMPAALADGGPIRLCDTGPTVALAARDADIAAPTQVDGSAPGDAHHLHDHDHDHDHNHRHDHSHASGGAHDNSHSDASHHDWERCYLGGLSSFAALASDWQFTPPVLQAAGIASTDHTLLIGRVTVSFRPRGPPLV
jgi:hypothetical protein